MTAEVAIINSNAVAIAADSAVTIGRGKKIYNSAIKVFALSKIAPVGIMVYGNASLLGVPWETIIKIYRSELKYVTYQTLEDYARSFLDFLKHQNRFFPPELQSSWIEANIQGYFELIRETLFEKVQKELKEKGKLSEEKISEFLKESVAEHHDHLKKISFVEKMTEDDEKKLQSLYGAKIKNIVSKIFQNIKLDRGSLIKLHQIASFLHTREIFSDSTSGVVISGFGEVDIYPVVSTHEIEGVFCEKLKYKYREDKSYRIKSGADCSIIPFAQDDMVASFMEGTNPSVSRFIVQYLEQLFSRLPELVTDEILIGEKKDKENARRKIREDASKLLEGFFKQLQFHKQIEHIGPILSMVQVLPKDELAAMAESLVNLTAFKRRMTDVLETVGGPIDVAVISKGDGLVWVKRKLYFPKELNQHFFANYFKGFDGLTHMKGEGDEYE